MIQDYDRLHIDDGIMDIKGQHLTKQIVTTCSRWNIIMNLHGTNISKTKE
jgi:hypothetical protein